MNFLSFEYFVALSKAGSLRDAADSLMISQQALSAHIRRLEQELDAELLTRTRPVRLTPCGRRFASYAADMLVQRQQLERDLSELSGRKRTILISVPPNGCPPFLSDVVVQFSSMMPGCLLQIGERPGNLMDEELRRYDFHISECRLSSDLEYIQIQSQREGPPRRTPSQLESNCLAVLVRRDLLERKWGPDFDHKQQALQETRDLQLLKDVPFIRAQSFHSDAAVDKYLAERGFAPATVACASNLETCLTLCCAGAGALIAPEGLILRKLGGQRDGMLLFPMDCCFPAVDLFISYARDKQLTPQEQLFIRLVCDLSHSWAPHAGSGSDRETL